MGLQLTKPTVFIMLGYPGAGKTYFSRRFSDKLGILHLQSDRIRYELFEEPSFNVHEEAVVERMIHIQAEQLLTTGSSFVLDGDYLLKKSRRQIYELAKNAGYRVLVVWCQTDISTCQVRASKRDRRNPDNQYSFDLDGDSFAMISGKLKKPNGEPFIVVSGKHDFSVQLKSVVARLERIKYLDRLQKNSSSGLKDVINAVSPKRRARSLDTIPVTEK